MGCGWRWPHEEKQSRSSESPPSRAVSAPPRRSLIGAGRGLGGVARTSTSATPIAATSSASRRARAACSRSPTTTTRFAIPTRATGPPGQPQDGLDAGQRPRRPHRRRALRRQATASAPARRSCVKVPGLDTPAALAQTGAVPINHIGRYREPEQPIVVIDAEHGQALADLGRDRLQRDEPGEHRADDQPGENFASGHRYIVALRNLKTAGGQTIPAPAGFRYYRDRAALQLARDQPAARRTSTGSSRPCTRRASSATTSTWPGTSRSPATTTSPSGRSRCETTPSPRSATHDLADRTVEGTSPQFTVTDVQNFTAAQDPQIARRVKGTVTVPCYLAPSCAPGGRFALERRRPADAKRQLGRQLRLHHPALARSRAAPLAGAPVALRARPVRRRLRGRIEQPARPRRHLRLRPLRDRRDRHVAERPRQHGRRSSATSRNFPKLADRLQQGLLDELFLGRVMIHPGRLQQQSRVPRRRHPATRRR